MLYVVKLLYAWLLPPGLFILLLLIAHTAFIKKILILPIIKTIRPRYSDVKSGAAAFFICRFMLLYTTKV